MINGVTYGKNENKVKNPNNALSISSILVNICCQNNKAFPAVSIDLVFAFVILLMRDSVDFCIAQEKKGANTNVIVSKVEKQTKERVDANFWMSRGEYGSLFVPMNPNKMLTSAMADIENAAIIMPLRNKVLVAFFLLIFIKLATDMYSTMS